MNTGGLLLLTAIFSILLIIVQRSERKRRRASAFIMLLVGGVIWRYGLYVLDRECIHPLKVLCDTLVLRQSNDQVATQTVVTAFILAIVTSVLFWALIGRYNPVGSSDAIKVYGRNDEMPGQE